MKSPGLGSPGGATVSCGLLRQCCALCVLWMAAVGDTPAGDRDITAC